MLIFIYFTKLYIDKEKFIRESKKIPDNLQYSHACC